jgi:peptide/nickel transport system substrate-binding protein
MCAAAFTGCKKVETEESSAPPATESVAATPERSTTPLVVAYDAFSEKFSPFFADTAMDQDVINVTFTPLLTTDRTGAIVYNAIEGETIPYNGTDYTYTGIADLSVNYDEAADQTVYKWKLRDDIKFSDGEPMTADDVIFSYYVLADPSYTGSSTLYSVPILGMQNYRTQTSDEVYAKYNDMFDAIYAAGADHTWSSSDAWTQEQQDSFWAIVTNEWKADVQAIVDYVLANYMSYAADYFPDFTADQITSTPGLDVAFGMCMWGYGTEADGTLTTASGATFDLAGGVYPTIDDYYNECYAAYGGDPGAYDAVENADGSLVMDVARGTFISTEGPKDPSMGAGIPNIAGIKKTGDYEVEITVEGFDATAVYSLGIAVAPLHYYGALSKYDYDNNKFGFDFGDLSGVQAKTPNPVGAGPYRFIKYENKVVYFEGNDNYYKGTPLTYYMQFKETLEDDKTSAVGTGTVDISNPSFSNDAVEQIKGYNSNGEITGDKIVTSTVDNLGYGYIGLNAATINVGGVPDSDASKNLRRAFATLFAAYRELSVDSYYGERATVINYPISNTSWAAPQPADEGYKVAFSTAVDGSDIYTSDMSSEEKLAAALQASIDYFKAAGYTWDEASGKFTAAPAGAKLEYELIIGGDGTGNHPSFMLVTEASQALATIGINLIINDPTDSNVLWDKLDTGEQEMWCAAWQATIDPDMYQVYYSNNVIGNPGSSESNHYHITDPQLDELIMEARQSDDQSFRKTTYKACLDIIIDWAVEIPVYQRQNCILFSAERINMDTVTPDITTFWPWWNDIEKIQMADAS